VCYHQVETLSTIESTKNVSIANNDTNIFIAFLYMFSVTDQNMVWLHDIHEISTMVVFILKQIITCSRLHKKITYIVKKLC